MYVDFFSKFLPVQLLSQNHFAVGQINPHLIPIAIHYNEQCCDASHQWPLAGSDLVIRFVRLHCYYYHWYDFDFLMLNICGIPAVLETK